MALCSTTTTPSTRKKQTNQNPDCDHAWSEGHGTGPDPEDLRRCLEDSCQALEQSMSQIDTVITGQVAEKCLPALKQVADIPRLYRRTNRELPSKALAYVHELLQPIQDFNRQVKEAVESSRWGNKLDLSI